MTDDLETIVRELKDRQEIFDCLTTYCRAVDRMDRELLLTCYHEDAIDDHGVFVGDREAFADWVMALVGKELSWSHYITNHRCEIDGDVAHTETYFIGTYRRATEPKLVSSGGRYVDRLERRGGRWAIAVRKVLKDWWGKPGDSGLTGTGVPTAARGTPPSRDRHDPSYQRPLTIPADRLA